MRATNRLHNACDMLLGRVVGGGMDNGEITI